MDIGRLIEETDAKTVAEFLQMELVRKGKYEYIRCPGHMSRIGKPDMNIGNAYLKRRGYVCRACNGIFVNTHDMVMEVTGCSSDEAYQVMADAMDIDLNDATGNLDESLPRLRLSKAEAEAIKLYPRYNEIVVQKSNQNGMILVYDGLFALFKQNPDMYYKIIVEKAMDAKKTYECCMQHYAYIGSDMAYAVYNLLGDQFDNSIYEKMKRELDDRIKLCQKIISIFSRPQSSHLPQGPAH